MRIYLAFFQTAARGPETANYDFWADMLRAGLEEAGHTVLESPGLDWAAGMAIDDSTALQTWKDQTWERAVRDVATWHSHEGVDLFLGYFFPKLVHPAALKELRRIGIPSVNFFCDNVREFRRVPEAYRAFDLHWVPEWEALSLYRDARLAHVHAPMPMWVPPPLRSVPEREEPRAIFLGSRDAQRARFFTELAEQGGSLDIRGKGWIAASPLGAGAPKRRSLPARVDAQIEFFRQHGASAWFRKCFVAPPSPPQGPPAPWLGPPVGREDYLRLTRECAVAVGVNRFESPRLRHDQVATYSRLRDIEAPMLGACYLTELAPGLGEMYEFGAEIAVYRDARELAEQLDRLLADPAGRRRMRRAAQERALREHSIAATVDKIKAGLGSRRTAAAHGR